MKSFVTTSMVALILAGCGARQGGVATAADPAARQRAINEVTRIAAEHCERGVHGSTEHVATDGPLLIVGTAGEIIEGRASLEEVNASYETRNVVVRHECGEVQRLVYASNAADVVWVEEALRTHASWPGFSVDFPSQRTMIFERVGESWRLRYYSLSVRLPDDQLDEAYARPATGDAAASAPAAPADAPAEAPAAEPAASPQE